MSVKTGIYLRIKAQNIELTEALLFYRMELSEWIMNLSPLEKDRLIYKLLEVIRSG